MLERVCRHTISTRLQPEYASAVASQTPLSTSHWIPTRQRLWLKWICGSVLGLQGPSRREPGPRVDVPRPFSSYTLLSAMPGTDGNRRLESEAGCESAWPLWCDVQGRRADARVRQLVGRCVAGVCMLLRYRASVLHIMSRRQAWRVGMIASGY